MNRLTVLKRHYSQVSSQFSNIAPPPDPSVPLNIEVLWRSQHRLYPVLPEIRTPAKHDLLEIPRCLHPGRLARSGGLQVTVLLHQVPKCLSPSVWGDRVSEFRC